MVINPLLVLQIVYIGNEPLPHAIWEALLGMGSDHTSLLLPSQTQDRGEISRRVSSFVSNGEWDSVTFNFQGSASTKNVSLLCRCCPHTDLWGVEDCGLLLQTYARVSLGGGTPWCFWDSRAHGEGWWVTESRHLPSLSPFSKPCPWHQWSGPPALGFLLNKPGSFSMQSLRDAGCRHTVPVSQKLLFSSLEGPSFPVFT